MSKTQGPTIWQHTEDDNGIVTLSFDLTDSSTNILTAEAINELETVLDRLYEVRPRGLILTSAKPNGFIAGADVSTFAQQHSISKTYAAIRRVQKLFDRLEDLPCPTVAVIHGFCLGGGLELALACDYRLADDDAKTQIGLPEVKLGIHPGYGGSVRLNELVGVLPAMKLMLTGQIISARAAQKIGVITQCLPQRLLLKRAHELILYPPVKQRAPLLQRILSYPVIRIAVASMLKTKTASKVNINHYPAPFELIKVWQKQAKDRHYFFSEEATSVAKLILTPTAQNLVKLFLLQKRLKDFAKEDNFSVKRVHVIGAGVMGGDIASWCALRGLYVTLQDQSVDRIAPAIARAHSLFKYKLKQPHLIQSAMDRLIADTTGDGVSKADIVIEAIFEDLAAKQKLYQQIEPNLPDGAILATNTSSIPLEQLSTCLSEPSRLVGIHFFNPVAKMQLVEVVSSPETNSKWQKKAASFVRHIGRLPLPVKSTPGFLVNRILMPYLLEAVTMTEEGIDPVLIDHIARSFGMPVGPIELADNVGLDICLSVASMLAPQFGVEVPPSLQEKVKQGHLGRKSGQGFYRHPHKIKHTEKINEAEAFTIEQRLILRLINECIACLDEEIVADSDLLDAGVVFGTGFAPFRGGPMHYLSQQGSETLKQQLDQLQSLYGDRFQANLGWEKV